MNLQKGLDIIRLLIPFFAGEPDGCSPRHTRTRTDRHAFQTT